MRGVRPLAAGAAGRDSTMAEWAAADCQPPAGGVRYCDRPWNESLATVASSSSVLARRIAGLVGELVQQVPHDRVELRSPKLVGADGYRRGGSMPVRLH